MNRSNAIILSLLVVALLVAIWYTWSRKDSSTVAPPTAADTALGDAVNWYTDLKGNEVDLAAYDDTIRVVYTWASWSPFSVSDLPALNKFSHEYQDQGVVTIAINRAEPVRRVQNFLSTINDDLENILLILDDGDHFYKTVSGFSMPETLIYDQDGNLVAHHRGALNIDKLKSTLKKVLSNETG